MADNTNNDALDTQTSIKKEFYTREGPWKSLQHSVYTKPFATTTTANSYLNSPGTVNSFNTLSNSDQVKISFVKITNRSDNNDSISIRCNYCNKSNSLDGPGAATATMLCELCNRVLKFDEYSEYIMFNYSKELYLYHFSPIKEVCSFCSNIHNFN
jgi:hypothetical protein